MRLAGSNIIMDSEGEAQRAPKEMLDHIRADKKLDSARQDKQKHCNAHQRFTRVRIE